MLTSVGMSSFVCDQPFFLAMQLQKQSTEFGSAQYYHNICKAITSGFFMQVWSIQST